eukprot:1139699-Pelagomonas_calceolata.AAC.5
MQQQNNKRELPFQPNTPILEGSLSVAQIHQSRQFRLLFVATIASSMVTSLPTAKKGKAKEANKGKARKRGPESGAGSASKSQKV